MASTFMDPEAQLDVLKRYRGWIIALGVLFVILGFMAILSPFQSTFVVTWALGWILIISGVVQAIHCFTHWGKDWGGFWLELILGVLYVLAGIVLTNNIVYGVFTLTMILAIWFLIDGVFRLIKGFRMSGVPGRGWVITAGILSLILGLMIFSGWPGSATWVLGLLVGIQLLFAGWTMIMVAIAAHKALPDAAVATAGGGSAAASPPPASEPAGGSAEGGGSDAADGDASGGESKEDDKSG